jgi:hypothetical protein
MIQISDLSNLAVLLDRAMLDINVLYKEDRREDLTIVLHLEPLEFQSIDEKLYENENKTLVGYEVGTEINVNIIGINFKLIKKEKRES